METCVSMSQFLQTGIDKVRQSGKWVATFVSLEHHCYVLSCPILQGLELYEQEEHRKYKIRETKRMDWLGVGEEIGG